MTKNKLYLFTILIAAFALLTAIMLSFIPYWGGTFGINYLLVIALVDVGWKGSIQNNIYKSLDGKVSVQGYFLGSLSPTEINRDNLKNGILFSDVPEHSPDRRKLTALVLLFKASPQHDDGSLCSNGLLCQALNPPNSGDWFSTV